MFWEHFGFGVLFALIAIVGALVLYSISYLFYYTWKTDRKGAKVVLGCAAFVVVVGLVFGVVGA